MEVKGRIIDLDVLGRVIRTRFAPVRDEKTREFDALLAKIK